MLVPALLSVLQTAPVAFVAPTRELQAAQMRFESLRRVNLPLEHAASGRCDVRVGRFCYWSDSIAPPPPRIEPHRVTAERARLLGQLAQAAAERPKDPWLAGQRVRYLIEAGHGDSVATIACAADAWWCAALRGLAFHVASRPVEAEREFDAALRAMPQAIRCEWTNLAAVTDEPLASEFERADCATRVRLAEVAWRLIQPLWTVAGHDARAEHLSRKTMVVILAGSATPHGPRWTRDMEELLVRYGWSERYTRSPPAGVDAGTWSVTGHGREPNWNLMPRVASLAAPWVDRRAWSLRAPSARMHYAPRHVSALVDLPHQLARIPRGDSMEIAVAVMPPRALRGDSMVAAMGVLRAQGDLAVVPIHGSHGSLVVPSDTLVVSVEARGTDKRAARARYSVAPLECQPAPLCLSDLLLFEGGDTSTLAAALERPLGEVVAPTAPLGVWWHVRGAPATLSMTAELEPERSAARRALESVRLAQRSASARIHWQMPMHSDTASAHVTLRLPEGARGRYRITLTARAKGSPPVASTRTITVR